MKISKKLFLGFSLIIGLAIVVGVIGITGMFRLRTANLLMYEKQVVGLEYTGKAMAAYKQTRIECRQVVISSFYDDLKGASDAKIRFETSVREFGYWIRESKKAAATDELLKFCDTITALFNDTYLPKSEEIIAQSISDTPDHFNKLYIKVLLASIADVSDQMENLIIGSMDLNTALADQANNANDGLINLFISAQTFLLIAAVIAAAIVAFYITRSISEPISESAKALSKIAKGDFDTRVKGNYKGELATIKNSVNETAMQLSMYLKEKLQEEKIKRLAAIVAIADAGIIVKDKDGMVREWNIGAENILGYTSGEMVGRTTHDYAPEESHKSIDDVEARLEKGEHIIHVEVVRKHKDGRLVDCSASYTPIFDSAGNFEGSVAIFHDITVNKLAAKKARDLAAIVSVADAGIVVKDAACNILEWNIGAENILGYTHGEIIGKNTKYYVPEEGHPEVDKVKEYLRRGEHTTHVEVVRKHKDGKLIDCSASYTPIFDDNGEFAGSVAVFHDISDKKQIELALQKAHETILSSIEYSSKLQKNLLPRSVVFEQAFKDYSVIWEPRDIVGGDIYWLKNFSDGSVLCVCDCTGHGTPGALLTMLVASTLDTIINEANYKDTAQIMCLLDQKISTVLNAKMSGERHDDGIKDGCDLAVLYMAKDGCVNISAGHTHVFVCDGKEVKQIKGQNLYIGEGRVIRKDDIEIITVPANPNNKFYVASDGLYDQPGGEPRRPFGYKMFMRIILENHNEKQAVISEKIWEAFESYRGKEARRDDMELITFKP